MGKLPPSFPRYSPFVTVRHNMINIVMGILLVHFSFVWIFRTKKIVFNSPSPFTTKFFVDYQNRQRIEPLSYYKLNRRQVVELVCNSSNDSYVCQFLCRLVRGGKKKLQVNKIIWFRHVSTRFECQTLLSTKILIDAGEINIYSLFVGITKIRGGIMMRLEYALKKQEFDKFPSLYRDGSSLVGTSVSDVFVVDCLVNWIDGYCFWFFSVFTSRTRAKRCSYPVYRIYYGNCRLSIDSSGLFAYVCNVVGIGTLKPLGWLLGHVCRCCVRVLSFRTDSV